MHDSTAFARRNTSSASPARMGRSPSGLTWIQSILGRQEQTHQGTGPNEGPRSLLNPCWEHGKSCCGNGPSDTCCCTEHNKEPKGERGGLGSSSWLWFLPLDADALVLVALSCYHHVSLVQNKHLDLLGVNELQLGAPVQDGPWGANDNLLTDLLTSFHCGKNMFSSGIPKAMPGLEISTLHILSELSDKSFSDFQTHMGTAKMAQRAKAPVRSEEVSSIPENHMVIELTPTNYPLPYT